MTSLDLQRTKKTDGERQRAMVRIGTSLILSLGLIVFGADAALGQIVGIPFAGNAMGLAPGTGSSVCSTALDAFGDGCPATQASLGATPQSVWSDSFGNLYIADYGNYAVRVVYRGGAAVRALIAVNNPSLSGTPQLGYIYLLGGTRTGALGSSLYCNGTSGTKAIDSTGTGCPAYEAYIRPTGGGWTDAAGNVFYRSGVGGTYIRMIYAGGTAAANLINLELGVSSPVVGSDYRIAGTSSSGYSGDGGVAKSAAFNSPRSLIVDSNENIYIADASNNVVRKIDGTTGIVSAFAGGQGAGCVQGTAGSCTATFAGDGGVATSASLSQPYEVALDANNNVYIADGGNQRIRVVYEAGSVPGISNPTVGHIYTVAGGGSSTTSGTTALSLSFTLPRGVSLDSLGNIYVVDSSTNKIWRIDGTSSIGTLYAGGGSATTVGGYCSGSVGQKATDTVGDGCPATQSVLKAPSSRLVFDANGVAYIADQTNTLVRSFTFNERFADTAVGQSSTFPVAVTSPASFAAPSLAITAQGGPTSEFASSNVNCASGTVAANTVCTYNVSFTPDFAGPRVGDVKITSTSSSTSLTYGLDGNGLGPMLAVAPNPQSNFATSITAPGNVLADQQGNIYVSDPSHGTLWKRAVGGTFTAALTGLSSPAQAAIDGAGNVYVADSGNNRVIELSAAGASTTLPISGLSSPGGIVSTGNSVLYIADTGNSRILRYYQTQLVNLALTGLNGPTSLALDGEGTLYIADAGNDRIVSLKNDGTQSTVSIGATITPTALAIDAADDLYIADKSSDGILFVPPGSTTVVNKVSGLSSPAGIALDGAGNLYYSDAAVAGVSEIAQQTSAIIFANTNYGDTSASQPITVNNIGNQAVSFTSANTFLGSGDTADFAVSQSSPACGAGPVASGGSCTLTAGFSPVSVGAYQEILSFPSNAINAGSASVKLTGTGVNLIRTALSVTLTSPASGNVSYGQNAVYTATITPSSTTTTLSGNIVVNVDGTSVQTLPITGVSTQFTLVFTAGLHVVTVTYSGDSVYASSYTTTNVNVVLQSTATSLVYTTSLQSTAPSLTLTAHVIPAISGTPTGTVTFYNGSTALGSSVLTSQDIATYTTTKLTSSSYDFHVVYSGDINYMTSSSATTTLAPDFAVIQATSSISAADGYPVETSVNLIPYFGYSGTLTYSCTGMPVNGACRFQPQSVALSSGTSQTLTVQFFTNLSSSLALLRQSNRMELVSFAGMFAPFLVWLNRRRNRSRGMLGRYGQTLLLVACCIGIGTLAGCGRSDPYPGGTTPTGTSTVVLTVTDASGLSHAVSYQFTVH